MRGTIPLTSDTPGHCLWSWTFLHPHICTHLGVVRQELADRLAQRSHQAHQAFAGGEL
jgi:hypothetical protein